MIKCLKSFFEYFFKDKKILEGPKSYLVRKGTKDLAVIFVGNVGSKNELHLDINDFKKLKNNRNQDEFVSVTLYVFESDSEYYIKTGGEFIGGWIKDNKPVNIKPSAVVLYTISSFNIVEDAPLNAE